MAEFDEIKVGNLYRMSSDRYFVLVDMVKKTNILSVPIYDCALVKYGISGKIESGTYTRQLHENIRMDDTYLNCEILILGENKPQTRKTTISQFWKAYDCVAEVPPETTI